MIDYILFVLVDRNEMSQFGLIKAEDYELWNSGEIDTDADDHSSLFWSDYTLLYSNYLAAMEALPSLNGRVVDILGAIAY